MGIQSVNKYMSQSGYIGRVSFITSKRHQFNVSIKFLIRSKDYLCQFNFRS